MPASDPIVSSSAMRAHFPSTMPATRNVAKNSKRILRQRRAEPVADPGRERRGRPHRDRHREQIGENRDRAAQQAGVEAGDHGNDQSETDDDIENAFMDWNLPPGAGAFRRWSMNRVCDR